MAAVCQSDDAMSCMEAKTAFRINKTFFELADGSAHNVGFRRVSSDPSVYNTYWNSCSEESGCPEEQDVDYVLAGLSDCESEGDITSAGQNGAVRYYSSVTCSTRSMSSSHGEGESVLESDCEVDVDVVESKSSYACSGEGSSVSTPDMFPVYQPSGVHLFQYDLDGLASLSTHDSAVVACHDRARTASGSKPVSAARLSAENERLAAENNLLRENMRLAMENQALEAAFAAALRPERASRLIAEAEAVPPCVADQVTDEKRATSSSSPNGPTSELKNDTRTTVMWRNLPNNYTRAMLLKLLDDFGFSGLYDFVYMPIDFKTRASLGYAFINLTDCSAVPKFWRQFEGFSRWAIPSKKASYVSWSDPHQGFAMNVDRYRNSPIMHESVPDEHKPVIFVNGVRTCFPAPTKKPRAPRHR